MASQTLQSTSTNQPALSGRVWKIGDLGDLLNILDPVAHKCIDFGIQLGVEDYRMQAIEAEYNNPFKQLREILRHRLRQAPLATYVIVQALKSNSIQEKQLASEIESLYIRHSSELAYPQTTCTNTPTAPSASTHHSVSQSSVQLIYPKPNIQPHSPPKPSPQILHVHENISSFQSPQPLQFQSHPPQYSSSCTPTTPLKTTPRQPQPSSSLLMSVPASSEAMSRPSLQLSQDVATLYCHEQQAFQGQATLQHIPTHEPQTVDQSHGTGSDSDLLVVTDNNQPPMAQYIDYVKSIYRRSVVEKKPVSIKWPLTPSKVYINLVCVHRTTDLSKDEADECTKAMVCDGNVDVLLKKKTPINLDDIAKNVPDSEPIILVEGAPGMGKSTFAWEFCRKWERGELAKQYQLVLLVRLRDEKVSKAQSLADLVYHPSGIIRQAVVKELESTHGINTLIILEGFDELPSTSQTQSSVFFQLINGELLLNATILVTSRPWATRVLHKECSDRIYQNIEIMGFTSDQIEEYVTSVFMGTKKFTKDKARERVKEVMSYIRSCPQIKACMYIPLNSAIVVGVYQESKAGKCILPKTLTELYNALTQTLVLRYLYGHPKYGKGRWKIHSLKENLPQDVYSKLLTISELAYTGICSGPGGSVQLIFSNLPPGFETLGLMQSVPQLYVTQGEDMSHNFLHLTVQEFLAALHISNMSPEVQLEHFQRQDEGRWRVVLRFLAGLTKLTNLSLNQLRSLLLRKPNEDISRPFPHADHITKWNNNNITADVELAIQHIHWMFETQRGDIVSLVLQEKTVEFLCHGLLTPLDYFTLGYCIVHSCSRWVLTVEDFMKREVIGEEKVWMLVAGVNIRHFTTAKVVGLRGHHKSIGLYERKFTDMGLYESSDYCPLSIPAKALNSLLDKLKSVLYLQELRLVLQEECCNIKWPDLSGLQVLHLDISSKKNWRLDSLLPRLSLQSLTIEVTGNEGGLLHSDAVSIGKLFLSFNCPKHVCITDKWSPITAEVAVGQHVHDKLLDKGTSSVEEKKTVECVRCRLDWYSLGCVIAHSNFQWVLTVEEARGMKEVLGKKEVEMLVAGARTRCDTCAQMVGLMGHDMSMGLCGNEDCRPLSIQANVLDMLFAKMKDMLSLQELHLNLPVDCCRVSWPELSGLLVLHLAISGKKNWKLDDLFRHLSLKSLTIEVTSYRGGLGVDNAASIGKLFLSSNCPQHVSITDKQSPITAEVANQHVYEKEINSQTYLVQEKKCISCRLDWYSLGFVIAHSKFQWVLTVENVVRKSQIRMFVAGAKTKYDTSAKVVGLRVPHMDHFESGAHSPLSISATSAEALSVLFVELKKMIHLQELHLNLPAQCSSIPWPNLSGMRVLNLGIKDVRNWGLDTLLPHLPLESLTIESTGNDGTVLLEDYGAIGMLLSSSKCLKCFHFRNISIAAQGMQLITTAISENQSLPLRSLVVEKCTFNDTAVHSLALFIANSSTLHHLSIKWCMLSANELLKLAEAIYHNPSLKERKLEYLECIVNGDDEATICAKLSVDYPHMRDCLDRLFGSFISDKGVKYITVLLNNRYTLKKLDLSNNSISDIGLAALARALYNNSTLKWMNLSNNSITETGSASLARALQYNSTLRELDLSNNSISDKGSAILAQALQNNSTLKWLNLSNNSISDAGSAALAQALQLNSTLKWLYLSNNNISDTGSTALAQTLYHNSSLWKLDLSGNDAIGAVGTHKLIHALAMNKSITPYSLFERLHISRLNKPGCCALVLSKRCEKYATQYSRYSEVNNRITFE